MGQVEPVLGPPLAVPGAGEQPVDQPLVRIRRSGRPGTRRLPRDGAAGRSGQGHAADQSDPISLRGVGKLGAFELGQDEPVDRVLDPARFPDRGRLGPIERLIRPVLLLKRGKALGTRLGDCGLPRLGCGLTTRAAAAR